MSVRRRAIAERVEKRREWDRRMEETRRYIEELRLEILGRVAERDGHRRMDDDGAPPIG